MSGSTLPRGFAKARLLAALQDMPGASTGDLMDVTGLCYGTVSSSLFEMRTKGTVVGVAGTLVNGRRAYRNYVAGQEPRPAVPAAQPNHSLNHASAPDPALTIDALAEQLVGAVMGPVMTLVEAKLRERLPQQIGQIMQKTLAALPAPAPIIERPKKPRVCIAGLLPQQAGMISTEFGDVFDLYFWKDGNPGQLKSYAAHCEVVYTMVSFISHDTEDLVRSAGGSLVRINGGMTQLRDKLTERFVGV